VGRPHGGVMQEGPQFDDTRKALAFALNFTGEVKASVMSRMMSQVQAAPGTSWRSEKPTPPE